MVSFPPTDPAAAERFARLLDVLPYADDERHPTRVVRAECLRRAPNLTRPDFAHLAVPDLELLFDLYDRSAFDHVLSSVLPAGSPGRPQLRVSNRMTRSAGQTVYRRVRISPLTEHRATSIEIAISAPLLQGPVDPGGGTLVSGVPCRDRLAVLQRVFEHELVHALLFCTGGDPRCDGEAFRSLAFGLFGHLESTHQLELAPPVAQRSPASSAPGDALGTARLRRGDRVRFAFQGAHHVGVVSRITRRATVLVDDPHGARYSDGRTYRKFYVPLELLERLP